MALREERMYSMARLTYKNTDGTLCKLKDYEETGLTPDKVRELIDKTADAENAVPAVSEDAQTEHLDIQKYCQREDRRKMDLRKEIGIETIMNRYPKELEEFCREENVYIAKLLTGREEANELIRKFNQYLYYQQKAD